MAKKAAKTRKRTKKAGETGEALVPEVVTIDQELVDKSVKWINKKYAETMEKGLVGILEIGTYVFANFFHGNADEVQFRGRQKENSFRALLTHPDLQMGQTWLYNGVNLAIQEKMLQEASVQAPEQMTVSHKVELLRVRELKDKKKLLSEVVEKGYSSRQLRDRISEMAGRRLITAGSSDSGDGFKLPRPIVALGALNLERLLSEKRLGKLTAKQLDGYRSSLEEARERIGTMIKAIDKARK